MAETNTDLQIPTIPSLTFSSFAFALTSIGGVLWRLCKKFIARTSKKGIYEVLDYQTTLIIHDPKGKIATLKKYEKVRFLQDNIIAYQDQAWGDGKFLLNYQCSPGTPVDFYRTGYKTFVLISLRDLKNKDETTEFNIQWDMKNCFLKPIGFWSTDLSHSTSHLKVQIIFPKSRPPKRAMMVESNKQRVKSLEERISLLPDNRYQITWEKNYPRLYEHYILKWIW